ncbi:uncharacterized protein LOC143486090 isoform X2 [Brachyhypopomus gauderio]|uniref:uncharacterized protein LOC143486090 isoform X2 n=1 Tax=Brachyhypopomus gauderio TaxID=698409 RepID=UPI0040427F32
MWTLLLLFSSLFPDVTGAVSMVTGYAGYSVQIRCPYESGYETNMKYLCRGKCSTLTIKDIPINSKYTKDERFSLEDNKTARVFTVTITDLRSEDGGTYWCGIQQAVRDHYTEILLVVTADAASSINSRSTCSPPTRSVSTSLHPGSAGAVPSHTLNYADHPINTSRLNTAKVTTVVLCKQKRKNMTSSGPTEMIPIGSMTVTTRKDEHICHEIEDSELNPAVKSTLATIYTTAEESSQAVYSNVGEPSDSITYCTLILPQQTPSHKLNSTAAEDTVVYSNVVI